MLILALSEQHFRNWIRRNTCSQVQVLGPHAFILHLHVIIQEKICQHGLELVHSKESSRAIIEVTTYERKRASKKRTMHASRNRMQDNQNLLRPSDVLPHPLCCSPAFWKSGIRRRKQHQCNSCHCSDLTWR